MEFIAFNSLVVIGKKLLLNLDITVSRLLYHLLEGMSGGSVSGVVLAVFVDVIEAAPIVTIPPHSAAVD